MQSLEKAHSGTAHPAIRGILIWEGHLVSSSLDGLIKVRHFPLARLACVYPLAIEREENSVGQQL